MNDSLLLEFDALFTAFPELNEGAVAYADRPLDEKVRAAIDDLLAKRLTEEQIQKLMVRLRHNADGIAYLASKLQKQASDPSPESNED